MLWEFHTRDVGGLGAELIDLQSFRNRWGCGSTMRRGRHALGVGVPAFGAELRRLGLARFSFETLFEATKKQRATEAGTIITLWAPSGFRQGQQAHGS